MTAMTTANDDYTQLEAQLRQAITGPQADAGVAQHVNYYLNAAAQSERTAKVHDSRRDAIAQAGPGSARSAARTMMEVNRARQYRQQRDRSINLARTSLDSAGVEWLPPSDAPRPRKGRNVA